LDFSDAMSEKPNKIKKNMYYNAGLILCHIVCGHINYVISLDSTFISLTGGI
jgi:hypothetical protein